MNYADVGMVLVRKEVLDNMAPTMRGKPVIDEDHREVNADDYDTGNFDGVVDSGDNAVWFDSTDASYHCSFGIKTKVLSNIARGFKVSCAYKVNRWGPGGIHNNVPYEREVLEGEYTHLAIVKNPRYEGVRIYNAKGAEKMKLMFWRKEKDAEGKDLENSIEVESSKSTIVLANGVEHSLDEGIAALIAVEEAREKENQLKNSQPKDTDLVDIGGGKKRSIADIKAALVLKNEKDEEDKKREKEDMEEKDKERKNTATREALENDHASDKHKDAPLENCLKCKKELENANRGHFERVQELSNSRRGNLLNDLPEPFDGIAEGLKRFGSDPATAGKK